MWELVRRVEFLREHLGVAKWGRVTVRDVALVRFGRGWRVRINGEYVRGRDFVRRNIYLNNELIFRRIMRIGQGDLGLVRLGIRGVDCFMTRPKFLRELLGRWVGLNHASGQELALRIAKSLNAAVIISVIKNKRAKWVFCMDKGHVNRVVEVINPDHYSVYAVNT